MSTKMPTLNEIEEMFPFQEPRLKLSGPVYILHYASSDGDKVTVTKTFKAMQEIVSKNPNKYWHIKNYAKGNVIDVPKFVQEECALNAFYNHWVQTLCDISWRLKAYYEKKEKLPKGVIADADNEKCLDHLNLAFPLSHLGLIFEEELLKNIVITDIKKNKEEKQLAKIDNKTVFNRKNVCFVTSSSWSNYDNGLNELDKLGYNSAVDFFVDVIEREIPKELEMIIVASKNAHKLEQENEEQERKKRTKQNFESKISKIEKEINETYNFEW